MPEKIRERITDFTWFLRNKVEGISKEERLPRGYITSRGSKVVQSGKIHMRKVRRRSRYREQKEKGYDSGARTPRIPIGPGYGLEIDSKQRRNIGEKEILIEEIFYSNMFNSD